MCYFVLKDNEYDFFLQKKVSNILVLSCDMVTDLKFDSMLEEHLKKGSALTMLTTNYHPDFINAKAPGPSIKTALSKSY